MMKSREQQHAKKTSPGFAVNRYAKKPEGTYQPKLPAPVKSKKPKDEAATTALATKAQLKQMQEFEKLGEKVKKVGSVFGIKKSMIMEAVAEGNIDHALSQFRRQAYVTIVNLIPIAEKEYARGKRDHQAYVLNAMITQGRELANDLMMDGDRSQLTNKLIDEVLTPVFKGLLQVLVNEMQQQKFMLSDKLENAHKAYVSQEIDQSVKRIATSLNEMHVTASNQIRRNILGE